MYEHYQNRNNMHVHLNYRANPIQIRSVLNLLCSNPFSRIYVEQKFK